MRSESQDTLSNLWEALDQQRGSGASPNLLSALERVANGEIDGSISDALLTELLTGRKTTMGDREYYSPVAVADFVSQLAGWIDPDSILDPTCGLGFTLHRAITSGKPSYADGVDINAACCEISMALVGNSANIHHGDFFSCVERLRESYDLIIADPPLNCRLSDEQRRAGIPGDARELAEAIAFWACSRLTDRGMLAMVVSPAVVRHDKFRKMILSTGARFRAFIHLPAGTSLATSIPTYMMLIEKGEQQQVFVAQLQSDPEAQRQLMSNLMNTETKGHPTLGLLHPLEDFTTYERIDASYRLEQRLRGTSYRVQEFGDVFLELTRIRGKEAIKELQSANSDGEPLYMDVSGRVYASHDEIPSGRAEVLRIRLNGQNVNREYFRHWLTSDVGKLALEAAGAGSVVPVISPAALGETRFHLPDLAEQLHVSESLRHLNMLRAEIAEIESACWTGKESGKELLARARNVNHVDRYEGWVESLPFPLATILWRHRVSPEEPFIRVLALSHFFEALAEFLATVHLSAFSSMSEVWGQHHAKLVRTLTQGKLDLQRATFGTWKCVVEVLGKPARKMLASNDERDLVLRMYALRDAKFLERLLKADLSMLLSKANKLRNDHIGHGGLIGTRTANAIESELFDMVNSVRLIFGRSWEEYELIKAGAGKHTAGTFSYRVPRLMGTRSQFESVVRETTEPLDDQSLYLLGQGAPRGLKLLPFIRVMASPPNVQNACYFYSRTEDSGQRFVSYHFENETEVCQPFEDTAAVLRDIMSVPASEGTEVAE